MNGPRSRRAIATAFLLAALSVALSLTACGPGEEPDPPVDPKETSESSNAKWLSHAVKIPAKMLGFVISTPKGWGPLRIPNDWGIQFAPDGEGWRPNFSVYWAKKEESLTRLFSDGKAKYLQGPLAGDEISQGEGSVAGMPARYLVFERDEKRVGRLAWIVWFYVGPDGYGEVKAECRAKDFEKYRPLFEEMTRRIRYRSS